MVSKGYVAGDDTDNNGSLTGSARAAAIRRLAEALAAAAKSAIRARWIALLLLRCNLRQHVHCWCRRLGQHLLGLGGLLCCDEHGKER